jgi:aminoglycoside phosphotransferase (APT) family kinase protein
VPGAPLLPALVRDRTGGAIPPALAACARVAAALHRTSLPVPLTRTLRGELNDAWAMVDTLAPLAPGLAASLHRSLSAVGSDAPDPGLLRTAHGDFRPSRVLFDGPTTSLLGFDRACLADPALDLGEFTAHLTAAVPAGTDPEAAARAADDLVSLFLRDYLAEGGGRAADALQARVAAYRTVALVRLAVRRWCRIQPQRLRSVLNLLDQSHRVGVS